MQNSDPYLQLLLCYFLLPLRGRILMLDNFRLDFDLVKAQDLLLSQTILRLLAFDLNFRKSSKPLGLPCSWGVGRTLGSSRLSTNRIWKGVKVNNLKVRHLKSLKPTNIQIVRFSKRGQIKQSSPYSENIKISQNITNWKIPPRHFIWSSTWLNVSYTHFGL